MLSAIFGIGHDLTEAKRGESKLPHGEFIGMVENDLPFGRKTAHCFVAIARDTRLSNVSTMKHLPPHYGTLYKIIRLSDETLERLIDDGTIRPETGAPMVAGPVSRHQRAAPALRLEISLSQRISVNIRAAPRPER